jgi:hypothetical protein
MFKIFNDKNELFKLLILTSLILFSGNSVAVVTPSNVYHKVSMINAEIKLIRNELGVTKKVREPVLQINKMPVHVYIKSLELFKKVSKLQKKHGIASNPPLELPIQDINSENVLSVVDKIYDEVIRVKKQLGINQSIKEIEFYVGRTPSNVYENIWQVSYLIDGMIKPIKSTDVYENTLRVQSELSLIASYLNIALPNLVGDPQSGKTPRQVHLQGYINMHKFALLEEKLNMKAYRVPAYPKTKISSSDAYDVTNMMLAEINRIKVHLGIKQVAQYETVIGRKRPSHALAEMNLINEQVASLTGISQ